MTASRDNRSEEGRADASVQGAALRRGRVVVGATGGTVSSAPPAEGPPPPENGPSDLGKTGKRPGTSAPTGTMTAGGIGAGEAGAGGREGSEQPASPTKLSSSKRGLSGTGYSEVPGRQHGEDRVSPASIPRAPRVPTSDVPVADASVRPGIRDQGGAPGGSELTGRFPSSTEAQGPAGEDASRRPRGPKGGLFNRTILGATPLKRVESDPRKPAGTGAAQTLASAPEGARTLFGGAASPVAERRISSHPPGAGSSAPPPVPDVTDGEDAAGGTPPRAPRTLESLRAVTTNTEPHHSGTMRGLTAEPVARAPLSGNAFNRTLTGASYVPRGGTFPRQRLEDAAFGARGYPESSGPPSPMRPAGARVVDSSTSSVPPSPLPPSSEALAAAISDAAAGQLRESEIPVPSERLDAGVLRQLGKLDEALKSSPRLPSIEPSSSPPGSDEASSRIPSSAFDAPSPGSVPALSALPERLQPHENSSGLPTVGRYEVLARLKSGGMGSVYMCRLSGNAGFRRLFAMKVLHAHLADDREALAAFEREARVLATLHHPNVVGVVDVGSTREPYIVLEYIEGGSLHELFRATAQGRDLRVVVTAVLEALEGLAAAHDATDEDGNRLGLVHCDVCPQNILVGVDGTARLTDFGIAQTTATLHTKQTVRGKPRYIAPERLSGGPLDCRADVFSMGAVLYAGLTGVDVFAGETTGETRRNIVDLDPAPPSEVGFRPLPALDWIVLKALAKDPASRFRSAEEFAAELRRVAEREGLLVSHSEVGNWVREVLDPSLRARRVAAQRGAGAVRAPEEEGAAKPGRQVSRARGQGGEDTSPISGPASSTEHTEIISDDEGAAGARESRWGLYLALALVVGVVGWAFIAPESLSRLFQVEPVADPTPGTPSDVAPAPEVVVPDIAPQFGSPTDEFEGEGEGSTEGTPE